MALIQCKECKNEVSDTAKTCPKCGAKVPPKTSASVKFIAGFIALAAVFAIFKNATAPDPAPVSAADAALTAKKEAEFQMVLTKVKALKASSKNPASFELEQVLLMDNGTVCVKFRATNSFNAVVPDSKAITAKNAFGSWDKECAGKTGTDYKRVRHAI